MNPYAYGCGNPTSFVDPDGSEPLTLLAIVGIGMLVSAVVNTSVYAYTAHQAGIFELSEQDSDFVVEQSLSLEQKSPTKRGHSTSTKRKVPSKKDNSPSAKQKVSSKKGHSTSPKKNDRAVPYRIGT